MHRLAHVEMEAETPTLVNEPKLENGVASHSPEAGRPFGDDSSCPPHPTMLKVEGM